ncbi:MAG: hypothetical protein HY678_00735 [Chloroflexi bacterium]|nr:hypothetical protein [Chloroflexota bacterium]
MKSILDEVPGFHYLDVLVLAGHEYDNRLQIIVVEGITSKEPIDPDEVVGGQPPEIREALSKVLRGSHGITIEPISRRFSVTFDDYAAWQVVNESWSSYRSYEQGDEGAVRTLTRSTYLDYFMDYEDGKVANEIAGPLQHFRIWTSDAVIDVISRDEPRVELWKPKE